MAHKHEVNIHNAGQARQVEHREHVHNPAGSYSIGHGHHHGHTHGWHTPDNPMLGTNGGAVSVDPVALNKAATAITDMQQQLDDMINHATNYTHETMPNGNGPVASSMRKSFGKLADDQTGLLAMLNHYRDNMDSLQQVLLDTAQQYQAQEESTQQSITAAGQPNQSDGV